MKIVNVYPACIMQVRCPACGFEGRVKREYPPDDDFRIICPKCNETFLVKINKRDFYRANIKRPVSYSNKDIKDPFAVEAKSGVIIDISRTGLRIEGSMRDFSKNYEKIGEILTLLFSLSPSKSIIKAQGEIVRVIQANDYKFTMGIRFKNLDVHTDQLIGTFLMP
ncbi:MAG: PilZ domain-containing protein [Nitrospirae bacterium]|nr:PilZ domain-containing protein [Nitrospirota bacterium]